MFTSFTRQNSPHYVHFSYFYHLALSVNWCWVSERKLRVSDLTSSLFHAILEGYRGPYPLSSNYPTRSYKRGLSYTKWQHRPGVEKYRSLCSALTRDWTFLRVRSAQDMESRPVCCGVGLAMVASAKGFFAVYDGAVYLPPQARKWFAAFDERGAGDGKPSFRKTG